MSLVNIGRESGPDFSAGSGVVDTTPQPLGPPTPVRKRVVVRAARSNNGNIRLGSTAESASDGYLMENGRVSPPIYVDDVNKIFVVAEAPGQVYSWIAS